MRILHTSDWHLGRSLEGRDRFNEQQEFLVELCDIADKEKVDVVLIAGDIFDTSNPPAKAEQLFYQGLYDLTQGGRRAVVAIAGNHDNPERLRASDPLAEHLGITLLGLPKDEIYPTQWDNGRVKRIAAGAGWMEIGVPGCDHTGIIIALPYPSEQRLKEMLVDILDEETMQRTYSQKVGEFFQARVPYYRKDTVNLCTSHLFVRGSKESDSERPIQLGGACTVDKEMLPLEAQYIALGHLHRPQKVGRGNIRYSGSPLGYSFSEAGHSKSIYLVDCVPRREAQIREIPLTKGRPLVKWEAKDGYSQVINWCEEGRDHGAWIDLLVHVHEPLQPSEIKTLRELRPEIINIRPILPEMTQILQIENRINLPVESLFKQFYTKSYSVEPSEDLVKLFLQLLDQERGEVS